MFYYAFDDLLAGAQKNLDLFPEKLRKDIECAYHFGRTNLSYPLIVTQPRTTGHTRVLTMACTALDLPRKHY